MHDQKKGDGRGKLLAFPARQMAKGKEIKAEPIQNEAANKLLMEAVRTLDEKKVEEALKAGAHPGLVDPDGNTLLHFSGYEGNYKISKLIIDYAKAMGIDIVNSANKQEKMPMDMVLDGRRPAGGEHAKVLAFLKINGGKWYKPDLLFAIGNPQEAEGIMRRIIREDLSRELISAAVELDIDYAKKLLGVGATANPTLEDSFRIFSHPLAEVIGLALQGGLTDKIAEYAQFLVDCNAKVDAPFMVATDNYKGAIPLIDLPQIWKNVPEDIQHLLRSLYDRQLANESLFAAAAANNRAFGESAIRKGANTDARNEDFDAPAHTASLRGNLEFVDFLIECNADLSVVNSLGLTLIHTAVCSGKADVLTHIAAAMRNAGIRPPLNEKDGGGFAPVHWAVVEKKYEMVEPLKNEGADLNVRNLTDESPLDIAVAMDDPDMSQLLIVHDAEITDEVIKYTEEKMGRLDIANALKKMKEIQKEKKAQKATEEEKQDAMKVELLAAIKNNDFGAARNLISQGVEITDDIIEYAEKIGNTQAAAALRKTQEKQKAIRQIKSIAEEKLKGGRPETEEDLEEPPEPDNLYKFPGRNGGDLVS